MKKTQDRPVGKRLLSLLLVLCMTLTLLSVTALADNFVQTQGMKPVSDDQSLSEVEQPPEDEQSEVGQPEFGQSEDEQPDGEPVEDSLPDDGSSDETPVADEPQGDNGEAADESSSAPRRASTSATSSGYYRITHLDCGRKYFSVDYIKSVIDSMHANGFNQLELAFGNGGLRFVLDKMDLTAVNGSFTDEAVRAAIAEGNNNFYNDPNGNALTQAQVTEIIRYARANGIEIVPLINMPGHMDGLLSSSLFSGYKLSGSEGSLDLNNSEAVAFGKALLTLYVSYFKDQGCYYFNFGADEYGQGIRNPYIESSVAQVSYNTLVGYMNDCADIIEKTGGMTARCFNDFVCYNNRTSCNLYKTVEVCYWSNQWNGSEYNTVDAIRNAGYRLINTNQKWYFVPSKSDEYGKSTVLSNFGAFDVTKFQNIKSGYNSISTTYSQIEVGSGNVGAMFCVWCDIPSVDVALGDVTDLITAMADANPNYFSKQTVPVEFAISSPFGTGDNALTVGGSATLTATESATWTSSDDSVISLFADTRSAIVTGVSVTATALKAGTATVTATNGDGNTAAIDITVSNPGEETITVFVGGTKTVTVEGEDLSNFDNTGLDTAVAEVEVEFKEGQSTSVLEKVTSITSGSEYYISDGTNYLTRSGSSLTNVTDPAQATKWTITLNNGNYYISSGEYYLRWYDTYNGWVPTLSTSSSGYTYWTFSNGQLADGYYNTSYLKYSGGKWTMAYNSSSGNAGVYKETSSASGPVSTITFTGKAVGTTSVVIGGVKYNINVIEDSNVSDKELQVNLWITNTGVVPTGWSDTTENFSYTDIDGNRRSIYTLKATYSTVNSETGIELSSILPALSGTARSWDGNNYDVVYWKSAYHEAAVRQSTDGWTNNSHRGVAFRYLRYWGGSWAYSVDGFSWVNIDNVGAGASDTAKNQVNLWYRQKTTITTEVETQIVDWGPVSYGTNQCLLDFAVKYDSGERVPNSFPVTGKTMGFDCPTDQSVPLGNGYVVKDGSYYYRTVYGIAGVETSDYEVYMITVTPSSDSHGAYINNGTTAATSYTYSGTEKIAWAKTEADAANSSLTTTNDITYGGEPFLESIKIYQYQGLLVTYYLRAKTTDDSLTVHYINRTLGDIEFHSYNIVVNPETTFDPSFAQVATNSLELTGNTVVNKQGHIQTVYADLKEMPEIEAQYRYVDFTCVDTMRSTDGKEVYLYYTFNNEKSFVIDFGLPLDIRLIDLSSVLADVSITEVEIKGATHGTAVYDQANAKITYTLTSVLSETETLSVKVSGSKAGESSISTVTYIVNIIPAATVYYEDSFARFTDGTGKAKNAKWIADGSSANSTPKQALEELGDKKNLYGTDSAYDNCTTFSMGSAKKVTVTSDMAANWNSSTSAWPTSSFTFKGTGFDVISLTDNQSGAIFVDVYSGKDTTGAPVKSLIVDNYYGYKVVDGKWVVDTGSTNALYQIPVIKVEGLDYGEYTAVVTVFYHTAFDHTAAQTSYSFWLDAVRVYDPMGKDQTIYTRDEEGYPQYIKLRNEVAAGSASVNNKLLFIDGKQDADVATYANYGPNNEVYLANGQAISFKLTGDLDRIATVQIGSKAPGSTDTAYASMVVGDNAAVELKTATEMYYDITAAARDGAVVTITNTGDGILSLTNLKITYNSKGAVSLDSMSSDETTNAVMAVRALFTPVVIAEPFQPDYFEASWGREVLKGQRATLTVRASTDVEAISVDGTVIYNYRTRSYRIGWGRNAKRVTYREFTHTVTATETTDYSVIAIDSEGVESEPVTARLTVRALRNHGGWRGFFGRWF